MCARNRSRPETGRTGVDAPATIGDAGLFPIRRRRRAPATAGVSPSAPAPLSGPGGLYPCQLPKAKALGLVAGATPSGVSETLESYRALPRPCSVRPADLGWLTRARMRAATFDCHRRVQATTVPVPLRRTVTGRHPYPGAKEPSPPLDAVSCVRRVAVCTPTVAQLSMLCQARTLKRAKATGAPPKAKALRVPRLKARYSEAHLSRPRYRVRKLMGTLCMPRSGGRHIAVTILCYDADVRRGRERPVLAMTP
jgi:hypothetical protein